MAVARAFDVAIIGGGIVGTATARALLERAACSLVILEAEDRLAAHQTGNNSGVIHSGLYYKPGSLKARNCIEGRVALESFCAEHGIRFERCGKLVVATRAEQVSVLKELELRGRTNGLDGIRRLTSEEIREHEPHAAGIAGLFVPQTGIVDYASVTEAYARCVRAGGGEILTRARVSSVRRGAGELVVETHAGPFTARSLVNCAGLQSDRVARLCGHEPGVRIVPFRGEYYSLKEGSRHLVRNLIYPVPDPQFPFLGVHFTRRVGGEVEAGPNAVLAFKREGYSRWSLSPRDAASALLYSGFWRLAGRYARTGIGEFYRSFNKRAFVRELRALVPVIESSDLARGGAGVRAQALAPDGTLIDDFRIVEDDRQIHVLNAPSPAATASISIGSAIAVKAITNFGLKVKC